MKRCILLISILFFSSIYAAPQIVGKLVWFNFIANPDWSAEKNWGFTYLNLDGQPAIIYPNQALDSGPANLVLGLPVETPIILYFDYTDYTGKIRHGCGLNITVKHNSNYYNGYQAIVNLITISNPQMVCTTQGDPNSDNFTINISSYAMRKKQ